MEESKRWPILLLGFLLNPNIMLSVRCGDGSEKMHVAPMCLITSVGRKKKPKTISPVLRASSRTIAGQEASEYLHKDRGHLCADRGNYPVLIPLSKLLDRLVLTDFWGFAHSCCNYARRGSVPARPTFGAAEKPAGGCAQAGEKICTSRWKKKTKNVRCKIKKKKKVCLIISIL